MGTSDEKRQDGKQSDCLNQPFGLTIELFQQYESISVELLGLDLKIPSDCERMAELQQRLSLLSVGIGQSIGISTGTRYPEPLLEARDRCMELQQMLQQKLTACKLELQKQMVAMNKTIQSRGTYLKGYERTGYFIDTKTK